MDSFLIVSMFACAVKVSDERATGDCETFKTQPTCIKAERFILHKKERFLGRYMRKWLAWADKKNRREVAEERLKRRVRRKTLHKMLKGWKDNVKEIVVSRQKVARARARLRYRTLYKSYMKLKDWWKGQ